MLGRRGSLVQPVRQHVPMFALGILALIVFCILLSLRFSVLAYQNHVNSQSAEEKVVDLQQRIERLAVAPAAMERAETFRNNLSV